MKELFKSLSENVSEECFNEILGIVEEIISERDAFTRPRAAQKAIPGREEAVSLAHRKYSDEVTKDMKEKGVRNYNVEIENGKPVYVDQEYEDDKINTWTEEPSKEVHNAYNELERAKGRLNKAKYVAGSTVGKALDYEDEHQEKVQAAKEANKK